MNFIVEWNPDRGFGFVAASAGRAFLHASAISPRPPRGIDLKGREVKVELTAGDKGLQVASAEIVALRQSWVFCAKSISMDSLYYEGSEPSKSLFIVLGQAKKHWSEPGGSPKPVMYFKELRRARDAGCPAAILLEAISAHRKELRAWKQQKENLELLEEAKKAARQALRGQVDKVAVVFLNEAALAAAAGNHPLADDLLSEWKLFISPFEFVGVNARYTWMLCPKSAMPYFVTDKPVGVSVGTEIAGLRHTFKHSDKGVFVGTYEEFDGHEHKGGRYGMVGENPNDWSFRNRD